MRIHSNQEIISTRILLGCLKQKGDQTASHVCGVCVTKLGILRHTKTEVFLECLQRVQVI